LVQAILGPVRRDPPRDHVIFHRLELCFQDIVVLAGLFEIPSVHVETIEVDDGSVEDPGHGDDDVVAVCVREKRVENRSFRVQGLNLEMVGRGSQKVRRRSYK
jgi:hypothetical protein